MSKIVLFTIPVNLLIVYLIFLDIKEFLRKIKIKENRKSNLLNEIIEIDLTKYEYEMLFRLAKLRSNGDEKRYLREMIKEVTR